MIFFIFRHLVLGGDPVHARVRLRPFPGGQRQRDPHHDHGLQVLLPQAHITAVQEVIQFSQQYFFLVACSVVLCQFCGMKPYLCGANFFISYPIMAQREKEDWTFL